MMIIVWLIKLLYLKDPNKAKYQYVIWKRENNGLKNVKDSKTFIEHSNNMQMYLKILKSKTQVENVIY